MHILTTGGTIDTVYTLQGTMDIGEPVVAQLLAQARVTVDVTYGAVFAKNSLDFTDAERAEIRRHVESTDDTRILITHGTDTMADTARYLLGITGKVVVLTGAIQPAAMRDTDAPFNLGLAFGAVQYLSEGVYIAMSGRIFAAGEVEKDRARGVFVGTAG